MKTLKNKSLTLVTILVGAGLGLSACSGIKTEAKYPTGAARDSNSGNDIYEKKKSIFGDGGGIFGSGKKKTSAG